MTRPLGGVLLRRHPEAARRLAAGSLLAGAAGTAVLAAFTSLPPALALAAAIVAGAAAGLPFAAIFTAAETERAAG